MKGPALPGLSFLFGRGTSREAVVVPFSANSPVKYPWLAIN